MPPLYRMPVFYVALIGAAALVGLGMRVAPLASSSTGQGSAVAQPLHPDEPTTEDGPPEPTFDLPDDGILRTPEGLRRKVLVRSLDLVPLSKPGGLRGWTPALDYFSIHFVLDDVQTGGARWLRIGPREGGAVGWVPSDTVLEWDTRLMARPTPRADRPPLVIYREKGCLVHDLDGAPCPHHGNSCPIEGEEDAEGADPAGTSPAAGLPILATHELQGTDGTSRFVYEVASLVSDRAPPTPPDRPPPNLSHYLNRVYVAFIVDTTASMRASIDAARALADRLADQAVQQYGGVSLRLALVEFRDEAPQYGFRTRIVTQFTDPSAFRKALERLEPATGGDGSVDEQMLDGMAAALPRPAGEPLGAVHHLDWPSGRAGELATKLLVLLGDAPDHDRDLARSAEMAERARAANISIAAVGIPHAGRSRDEEARYRSQWRTLAEGSYRPLDPKTAYQGPIEPLLPWLGGEEPILPTLQILIEDRVEHARQLAALAAAEAEARLEQYVTSQGLTLDQVHPILVDLHRSDPEPVARPDPRFGGRKAPSVRRGWIAGRIGGQRLVDVEVLMTRDELTALIDELAALQQAAEGTAADLRELIRIGTAAASGETAFLAADRGRQTFAEHLRRRQGLPSSPPESLLNQTQADLLQADAPTRAELIDRLAPTIASMIRLRDEPIWDDPRQTLDGMASMPYDWIDF